MKRRPADYPPPVKVGEFVAAPQAEEDERIDVGVVFVGGGPAGLAGAIRLAQLLERRPRGGRAAGRDADRRDRQGPRGRRAPAVGRGCQSRRRCATCCQARTGSLPGSYGPVSKESVYLMRQRGPAADPHPAAVPQQGQLHLLAQPPRPPPGGAGRGAGRDGAARHRRRPAAGRRRRGGRRPHRRQGPRPRRTADRLVRARGRAARPGHRAVRGHAGPPDRSADRALRRSRPLPAGLEPRRQGGLEGRASARPGHPHAGMAVSHRPPAPRGGRQLHLSDGRGHDLDRPRLRARLPRLHALRARLAAAVQDPPVHPPHAGGRRTHRMGREDDPRGRTAGGAEHARRPRCHDLRRCRRARQRTQAEGHPLRDAVGDAGRRGDPRRRRSRHRARRPGRTRRLRPGRPPQPHLAGPAPRPQHAPGAGQRDVRRRTARAA